MIPPIRAHLTDNFQADGFDIHLIERGEGRPQRLLIPGRTYGETRWHTANPDPAKWTADDQIPSLFLPREALEALLETAAEVAPPSPAQGAHLADAIDVRDRLLKMVENAAPGPHIVNVTEPRRRSDAG